MEATIPYFLNLVAICIAVFGVYQSAIRDYEQQRDAVHELRRQLDDCHKENQRLHEAQGGRSSGINISGGAVTIGKDAVGGDVSKRDELSAGGDMNVRKGET